MHEKSSLFIATDYFYMIEYIADKEHYTKVLAFCEKVKHDFFERISRLAATIVYDNYRKVTG